MKESIESLREKLDLAMNKRPVDIDEILHISELLDNLIYQYLKLELIDNYKGALENKSS